MYAAVVKKSRNHRNTEFEYLLKLIVFESSVLEIMDYGSKTPFRLHNYFNEMFDSHVINYQCLLYLCVVNIGLHIVS